VSQNEKCRAALIDKRENTSVCTLFKTVCWSNTFSAVHSNAISELHNNSLITKNYHLPHSISIAGVLHAWCPVKSTTASIRNIFDTASTFPSCSLNFDKYTKEFSNRVGTIVDQKKVLKRA